MKKIFMYAMLFAAASATVLGFNSCSSDDPEHVQTLTEEEGYLQKVLGSYVDNTINPTYASMAKNGERYGHPSYGGQGLRELESYAR